MVIGSASVARTASSTSGLATATARRRRRPLSAGTRARGLADGGSTGGVGTKAQAGVGAMLRAQSRTKEIEQLMVVHRRGPWSEVASAVTV